MAASHEFYIDQIPQLNQRLTILSVCASAPVAVSTKNASKNKVLLALK
jgi:hypothetical protein